MPRGIKRKSSTPDPVALAVQRFGRNVASLPKSFVAVGNAIKEKRLGRMVYNDMNSTGKKIVDTVRKKTGYISSATRAAMKRTNIAGKKGQLGAGWGE